MACATGFYLIVARQEIADGKGIPVEQVVSELWAAHRR
jgi:hypothetical protein